jgi:tryptophan-rich sensory protein
MARMVLPAGGLFRILADWIMIEGISMKLNYILIPLVVFFTALIGGAITRGGMEWYKKIKLPSWTPPGAVIGSVWTALFVLSASAAIMVWNGTMHDARFWLIIALFLVNAAANALWTYLFFGRHDIYAAFWESLFLELTILDLIWLIQPVSAGAELLLFPYAAWVFFASYLTYRVWQLNRQR